MGLSLFLRLKSEQSSLPSQRWCSGRCGREHWKSRRFILTPFRRSRLLGHSSEGGHGTSGPLQNVASWSPTSPLCAALPFLSPSRVPGLSCPLLGDWALQTTTSGCSLPRSSPDSEITPHLLIAHCYLSLSAGISLPAISTKILSHSG